MNSSSLEFDQIMQAVVEESSKAIGSEKGVVYIREEDAWVPKHVYGFPPDLIGARFSDSEAPFASLATKSKKPVLSHKAAYDKRLHCELMSKYEIKLLLRRS